MVGQLSRSKFKSYLHPQGMCVCNIKESPTRGLLKSDSETKHCQISGILKINMTDGRPVRWVKIQKLQKAYLRDVWEQCKIPPPPPPPPMSSRDLLRKRNEHPRRHQYPPPQLRRAGYNKICGRPLVPPLEKWG